MHVLDQVLSPAINEIVLAVSFNWQKIQAEIGGYWRDVKVSYAIEEVPLGTGGAIRHAMQHAGISEALIVNGDTLLKVDSQDLLQFATGRCADIAMALKEVENSARFGKVRMNEICRVVGFEEKGTNGIGLINAGVYYVKSSVFDKIDKDVFSFEKEVIESHYAELQIYGMKTDAYFIDMGIPEDLARAQIELSTR